MARIPNLPDDAWARIELVKRGAAQKRAEDVRLARREFKLAKSRDTETAVNAAAHYQDYQFGLVFAHQAYVAAVFFSTADELRKLRGADLGVEEINCIFLELRNKSCLEWLESGGDAKYADFFIRATVAGVKSGPEYLNLLEVMVDSEPSRDAEPGTSTSSDFLNANPIAETEPSGDEPTRTEAEPAGNGGNNGSDRRKAVDAYIEEVFSRTGRRINRTDIWKFARYKSRTEFERWERHDPRANKTANDRFTRILTEKPHLK